MTIPSSVGSSKKLTPGEKLNTVERLGVCRRCLRCYPEYKECTDIYLCRNIDCKRGRSSSYHHFFLCLKGGFKGLPQHQEANLHTGAGEINISACPNHGRRKSENPSPCLLLNATTNPRPRHKIGTLIDLASASNYQSNYKAARRQKF